MSKKSNNNGNIIEASFLQNITILDGKVYVDEQEYEKILDKIYEIPLYNGESIWPSVDECLRYEQVLTVNNVVFFYLWLQELNNHPSDDFRATLDHIDEYLDSHLVITKEKKIS